MPRLTLDQCTFAFDDSGPGESDDVLLLVHGHPFDRSMWRGQAVAAAEEGWRVIVPDLRGYGETHGADGKTTLQRFGDDLAALLDALGVDRCVAGGLSMGGQIVMELARTRRERLRGIVLAATFPRVDTDEVRAQRVATAERIEREGLAAYADELLPRMLAARSIAADPELATFVRSMMARAPAAGAAAALRGRAERPDYAPALAAFAGPALIVVGDADSFTSRSDADLMADLLRRSRLLWLPGIGHMPNLETAAAFDQALLAFLDEVRREPVSGEG
jgi:pimeloyl-ACP methyl ester carboxylesterase